MRAKSRELFIPLAITVVTYIDDYTLSLCPRLTVLAVPVHAVEEDGAVGHHPAVEDGLVLLGVGVVVLLVERRRRLSLRLQRVCALDHVLGRSLHDVHHLAALLAGEGAAGRLDEVPHLGHGDALVREERPHLLRSLGDVAAAREDGDERGDAGHVGEARVGDPLAGVRHGLARALQARVRERAGDVEKGGGVAEGEESWGWGEGWRGRSELQ